MYLFPIVIIDDILQIQQKNISFTILYTRSIYLFNDDSYIQYHITTKIQEKNLKMVSSNKFHENVADGVLFQCRHHTIRIFTDIHYHCYLV